MSVRSRLRAWWDDRQYAHRDGYPQVFRPSDQPRPKPPLASRMPPCGQADVFPVPRVEPVPLSQIPPGPFTAAVSRGGYPGSEPVKLPPPPRTPGANVNPSDALSYDDDGQALRAALERCVRRPGEVGGIAEEKRPEIQP